MQAQLMHSRLHVHRRYCVSIAAQKGWQLPRPPYNCRGGGGGAAAAAVPGKSTSSLVSRTFVAPAVAQQKRHFVAASAAAEGPAAAAGEAGADNEPHAGAAGITTSDRFTDAEQQALWDSVSRALLRLGKTGVTESHARSLVELLTAHKLVKVQHNGCRGDSAALAAAAVTLQEQSAGTAELLYAKGSTLLFGSSSSTNEQLLALAEASVASTAVWKTKRAAAAAERQQQRAAVEAKKESNASRSRKRIGQMIKTVAKPGPLDKTTLAQEWQQLAGSIAAEEAGGSSSSSSSSKRKAPWKK